MQRFVVLQHETHDGTHWDLMLEQSPPLAGGDPEERSLLTWSLSERPFVVERSLLPAKPLANHRRHYLDYEGPVSGDRGHVARVAAGTYEWTGDGSQQATLRCGSDLWRLEFIESNGDLAVRLERVEPSPGA